MSFELFQKISKELFPLTSQLILSAGAEPLLAKSFLDMLNIAACYDIPKISFVTNGTLLNQHNIERIIRAGVHIVIISFDGATSESYEAIRRGAKFKQVVGNIRLLQKIKARLHSSAPEIHFSTVLMRKNIEELPDILRLAKNLGVSYVGAAHLVPYKGLDMKNNTLNSYKQLTNIYLDKARDIAKELDLPFGSPPNFSDTERQTPNTIAQDPFLGRRCHWPWKEILINPEGIVYPCCYWYETTSMGNFQTQSFRQIWNGRKYKQLREELSTDTLCRTCLNCPIGSGIPDCNDDRAFSEVSIQRGV